MSDPVKTIAELPGCHDQRVTLQGWVAAVRSSGKVAFLQVRDGTGVCQCVVEIQHPDAFEAAKTLSHESSLRVSGLVRGDERAPGGCELAVDHVEVIQIAEAFPIGRKAHGVDFLLSHRHLWLRSSRTTAILKIRHTIIRACRNFFDEREFVLIDTPILSPGAGEDTQTLFKVDYFGDETYLTQTGQLYLESACMALGKVYCFGPTFRAEKSKTRRHLTEFWMLEPEVAFAELDDVIQLAEDMIVAVLGAVLKTCRAELELLGRDISALEKVQAPFPRMTYDDAVALLKSDALRADLEAELVADQERLQVMREREAEIEVMLKQSMKKWKAEALEAELQTLQEQIKELDQDLLTRPQHIEQAADFQWGKDLGGSDETILSRRFDSPLFVTDYPRDVKAFYMKRSESDPRVVRNMDLLAPEGYGEIIGGSQREADLDILLESLEAKGLHAENYDWYLDLRKYGSVPHGGFGLGIERTVSWLCGLKHVRETIPFPRTMGRIYP